MKINSIFQILILSLIIIIITAFYYSFFLKKNNQNMEISGNTEKNNIAINEDVLNELIDIEYNASDENGNTYYINAKKATIDNKNENQNIVNMEGVVAIINLSNKVPIFVYSNFATYNKENNNTFFYKDIKITYLDKLMSAGNLDLVFTEKLSKIYNKVILNSNNFVLYTDMAVIDMVSGDIKLETLDNSKKVKLIKK